MNRWRLFGGILAAAWGIGMAAAFVALDPARALSAAPVLAGLRALVAAALALLACMGAGGAILARLSPASLDVDGGWARATAAGLALWGLLALPWSLLFGVRPLTAILLVALLSAGWLLRPPVRRVDPGGVWWVLAGVILIPALIAVLAPTTATDELYYHVALPRRMLGTGHLAGGFLLPNGSRPLALHLPFAGLLALGGEGAPRAFCLLLGGATLLLVTLRARAWWGAAAGWMAPALLAGSWTFLGQASVAGNDLAAAFLVTVAAESLLAGGLLLPATLAAGGALAVKYTSAAPLLPLLLAHLAIQVAERRWLQVARLLVAGLGALLWVAPWWAWNASNGLHPLFPYAGWDGVPGFAFAFSEKYGLGRGPLDFLLLPWNAVMRAETDSFVFLGRVSPAFLALLPGVALAWTSGDRRARVLAATAAGGFVLWAIGAQWLRYLLPVLPLAALACAAGCARLPPAGRTAAWLAWAAGLPANWGPVLAEAAEQAPVAVGHEDPDAYLTRRLPAWPAIRWINEQTPPDARVALLFAWEASPIERDWVLGSVEDHVPTRYLLAVAGDGALDLLAAQRVGWVLAGRPRFIRKAYPFLDPETFRSQFQEPEEALHRLLEARAELVFESGRHGVWRLPPPSGAPAPAPADPVGGGNPGPG